uniref:Putative reverse transcriptase domain-containing protein n=1 Tax=Tanacetum cinerariifolium TaxID=118510 RepID=A0A699HEN4_TANCI|nr:putative reverse transcriptase domain-containing protein [Tanacetum cinerariifolium]
MVPTAAIASLFLVLSPQPNSESKTGGGIKGVPSSVDVHGIKTKSVNGGMQVKANAQAPKRLVEREYWMMLEWKTKWPNIVDLDPFGLGRIVQDGLVFRQHFSIRLYEIGANRTMSIETLMNHLQVASSGKHGMHCDWLLHDSKAGEILSRALRVGSVAYKLDLPEELRRVHNTFHVSNLKKCYANKPLAVPLDGLHFDDKLQFVEEPVEIMDREVKRLRNSRVPIVKVRWNFRRGHEFTWEREDQFKKKYPHLFTKTAPSSSAAL